MRSFVRLITPVVVIALGVVALVGCTYVPWFEAARTSDGTRVSGLLTRSDPKKPLRTGVATTQTAERWLGAPVRRSTDGRAMAYAFEETTGRWFGLCAPSDVQRTKYLFLRFGEDGTLADWEWDESGEELGRSGAWLRFSGVIREKRTQAGGGRR